MTMYGSLIVAGRTLSGHRDYLDDKPISAGAGIDLYDDGIWIPGRYEANFEQGQAYFVYDDQGRERYVPIDRERMRFRWP